MKGSYASEYGDSALSVAASIPYLVYGDKRIANGVIDVKSLNNQITGAVTFDTLALNKNAFYFSSVTANAVGDSVYVRALTKDLKRKDRYGLGAAFVRNNDVYILSMQDSLLLNYKKWTVTPDNKITYSPKGILVHNFIIANDTQKIIVRSTKDLLNSPVHISIDDFDVSTITSILNDDTLMATGTLNAELEISDFDKKLPSFDGTVELAGFQCMQQPVGDINITAQKKDDNTISATVALSDFNNDVKMRGNYYLNNTDKQFDANVDIKKLRMFTVQAFSKGNLQNSSGSLVGQLSLDGKFTEPHWKGYIGFDTVKMSIAKTGVAYSIDQQKIQLNYPGISLNKFTIKDSANHPLIISGQFTSRSLTEYDLDADINAKNFTLVNVEKAIDNQVYGFAAIDADIYVSGTSARPNIEGNLTLTDKSDVTIVLPENNVNKDAAKSVVRFIDRDTFALPEKIAFVVPNEKKSNFAQFLNYNLNIDVSKKATLTVVIDPTTGDALQVKGDAKLNAGVDPGGHIVLAGNYELNSGYYILNYQFLKRKFDLLPGSTIAFSGEPTDAQISIDAQYTANTSPRELLGSEISETDPKVTSSYNQKIPFLVILHLKGKMKKPEISFDIQLPESNSDISSALRTTIENKLTQLRGDVTSTNKQVFSLLLLNRFVGEQSSDFFKGNGGGVDDVARESVSKYLTAALDQIASDLIKGVDIDLNLNSYKDYTSGDAQQRTDLNVSVSKRFLDDRLSLSVGKNFGVEGQDASAKATQQQGNTYIPDVNANYKLSKDGRYTLRLYRKTQFEMILDGYVIETGLSFIVTMDYDKFAEILNTKN
ncbi:MAG: translocation/assembly module TamB [Sphingobacteriales bacterium]|nr:translocation/assembly module TamB [Sphingobacteriales bacterium]